MYDANDQMQTEDEGHGASGFQQEYSGDILADEDAETDLAETGRTTRSARKRPGEATDSDSHRRQQGFSRQVPFRSGGEVG